MKEITTSKPDLVEQLGLIGRMYNELYDQKFLSVYEQQLLDGLIHWQREILRNLEQHGKIVIKVVGD